MKNTKYKWNQEYEEVDTRYPQPQEAFFCLMNILK